MKYFIEATSMKMGRACATCRQDFEFEIEAESREQAIEIAKVRSRVNLETHKFKIHVIREVSK